MSLAALARYAIAESRGAAARLVFYVVCLGVGVGAVVAVAGLSAALDDGIRLQARTLLAADLAVSGRRPLPEVLDGLLEGAGVLETTKVRELVTVSSRPAPQTGQPGPSRLVELKSVEGTYPFYGDLVLEPDVPLERLAGDGGVVVAPEVLDALDVSVGDSIRLGSQELEIRGVVLSEPDRISVSFSLAPRVFVGADDLGRTGLVDYGSRVTYKALARFPSTLGGAGLQEVRSSLEEALPDAELFEVETWRDAQPNIRRGIERVEHFLGLVALLSLVVGGVGVAQAVRAFISGRLEAIAVLRCLGLRPREVFGLYLAEAAVLGVAGGVLGGVLGTLALALIPGFLDNVVRADLVSPWQPGAVLRGLALGVAVAVVFSLPALASVVRVPPARVFRRTAEPLPAPAWVRVAVAATVAGVLVAVAAWQAGSLVLGILFSVGFVAVFTALSLAARAAIWLVSRRRAEGGEPWVRHGLASLGRPGASTLGAVTALGVGISVVLALLLVERRLSAQLSAEMPDDAPSVFLVDVQPDQLEAVRQSLEEAGASGIQVAPMVVGRLLEVDGTPVRDLVDDAEEGGAGRRRWALTREQRMTYGERLPDDNRIVAGELWSLPDQAEVSVEEDFAEELGATLGSELLFDIQGVPVSVRVTSLRYVDWTSFAINFFVFAEPAALEGAPHVNVVTARVPPEREQAVQDLLAERFPNVTALRVRQVLDRVISLLQQLGVGVRALGAFTVIAGLAILGGAASASSVRRRKEVALLKTLGMTRPGIAAAFGLEYALLGVVAGIIGAGSGTLLAWAVTTRALDLPWVLSAGPVVAAVCVSVVLSVAGGLAASFGALREPPAAILKEG